MTRTVGNAKRVGMDGQKQVSNMERVLPFLVKKLCTFLQRPAGVHEKVMGEKLFKKIIIGGEKGSHVGKVCEASS